MQTKSIKYISSSIASLVFFINTLQAQQLPAAYTVTDVNQVLEWAPTSPPSGSTALSLLSLRDNKTTTVFVDGLGRPVQSVLKKGSLATDPANLSSSTNAVDLVIPKIYDQFGREANQFLPFTA